MKVTFRNDDYVRSHGKNPKGFGYWAFRTTLCDGRGGYSDGEAQPVFVTGTLTNAKKEMRCRVKSMNECSRCREIIIDVLG